MMHSHCLTPRLRRTDKMGTEPSGNMCWCLSLYSMKTSTQFYTIRFLSVSLSVSVSGSVNTT